MIYDEMLGTYRITSVDVDYQYFFPYVIHSFSPNYVIYYYSFALSVNNKLTSEQLIGISCGSAAFLFLFLFVIITVIRRRNLLNNQSSFTYSSSSSSFFDKLKQEELNRNNDNEITDKEFIQSSNEDIDTLIWALFGESNKDDPDENEYNKDNFNKSENKNATNGNDSI